MNLKIEELSFSYGEEKILDRLSFTMEAGQLLAVLGPNGAGKTTLFRCILGLFSDYEGRILLDGAELRSLDRRELAARIAYIPQIHRPSFGYTVLDTVLMGVTRSLSPFEQPGKAHMESALNALDRVGLRDMARRSFNQLSGGQQQLVLIARALVQDADILVMDEPTSALDYGNQLKVLRLVRRLADKGYTVLFSTHNPQQGLTFADKVLALGPDQTSRFGDAEKILDRQLMERLYGVQVDFYRCGGETVLVPRREELYDV